MANVEGNFEAHEKALSLFFHKIGGKEYQYGLNNTVSLVADATVNERLTVPDNTLLLPNPLTLSAFIGEGNLAVLSPRAVTEFREHTYPQDAIVLRDGESGPALRSDWHSYWMSALVGSIGNVGPITWEANTPPFLRASKAPGYNITSPTFPSRFKIVPIQKVGPQRDYSYFYIRNWELCPLRIRIWSIPSAGHSYGSIDCIDESNMYISSQLQSLNAGPQHDSLGFPMTGTPVINSYPLMGGFIDVVVPPNMRAYFRCIWGYQLGQTLWCTIQRERINVRHHIIQSPLHVGCQGLIADTPAFPTLVTDGISIGDADRVMIRWDSTAIPGAIRPVLTASHRVRLHWLCLANYPSWLATQGEHALKQDVATYDDGHEVAGGNNYTAHNPPVGATRVFIVNVSSVAEALYGNVWVLRHELGNHNMRTY